MTFSGVAAFGAAAALATVAVAAAAPSDAVGVARPPALHTTFRQVATIPPELLVGKQPPGFFAPGTEPSGVPRLETTPTPAATVEPSMEPTPSASVTPTPTASTTPTPSASMTPTPSASMTPTPSASMEPTPSASMEPTPSASMTPTPSASMTPTPSAMPTPTASPTPVNTGGALKPTRDRVSVRRGRGKVLARTRNAECVLTTYKRYRPRVTTRRNVVYTNEVGKRMAVVGLKRRHSCVIPEAVPSRGALAGVAFGGKVYASFGPAGRGGWCEAGVALAKDAVYRVRKSSRKLKANAVKVYVYTKGEAQCELVAGSRQPEEDD